jgi:bifunctional NMN adenylyltransferase/nudix hydrolase
VTKKYDYSVVIGRFQPFHLGHQELLEAAQSVSNTPIILLGSSFQARTPKNPFTWEERAEIIGHKSTVVVAPLRDYHYSDNLWVSQVQTKVAEMVGNKSVCLVGHEKDESSFYLKLFPQWDLINHSPSTGINATDIRHNWYTANWGFSANKMSAHSRSYIERWCFKNPKEHAQLIAEDEYYFNYASKWGNGPHITTDAVVTCCGHVLLIQRGRDPEKPEETVPGEGLWAFPGGFLGRNERIQDGMLRELKEETNIKVPLPALRGSIRTERCFDHPGRSLRGRVITHAAHIHLWDTTLPKVRAASDAKRAEWKTLAWAMKHLELFFEDHYQILECMISGASK